MKIIKRHELKKKLKSRSRGKTVEGWSLITLTRAAKKYNISKSYSNNAKRNAYEDIKRTKLAHG